MCWDGPLGLARSRMLALHPTTVSLLSAGPSLSVINSASTGLAFPGASPKIPSYHMEPFDSGLIHLLWIPDINPLLQMFVIYSSSLRRRCLFDGFTVACLSIYWRSFGLLLDLGGHELSQHEYCITGMCKVLIFISLGVILRSEIARPHGMNVFNFIRNCQAISELHRCPLSSVTYSTWSAGRHLAVLDWSHGVYWFEVSVAWACLSLMALVAVLCWFVTGVSRQVLGFVFAVGACASEYEPACESLLLPRGCRNGM